jgi:hypothetical protein
LPIVLKQHAKLLLLLGAKTLLDLTFNVLFAGVPLRSLFASLQVLPSLEPLILLLNDGSSDCSR